jgi:hypothetical protein
MIQKIRIQISYYERFFLSPPRNFNKAVVLKKLLSEFII